MADIELREMRGEDYPEVFALWRSCEGIGLSDSDSREAIGAYLSRNPGMSAVARERGGRLVGAVLCGDDGRRGYLHHLAVSPEARGRIWRSCRSSWARPSRALARSRSIRRDA